MNDAYMYTSNFTHKNALHGRSEKGAAVHRATLFFIVFFCVNFPNLSFFVFVHHNDIFSFLVFFWKKKETCTRAVFFFDSSLFIIFFIMHMSNVRVYVCNTYYVYECIASKQLLSSILSSLPGAYLTLFFHFLILFNGFPLPSWHMCIALHWRCESA